MAEIIPKRRTFRRLSFMAVGLLVVVLVGNALGTSLRHAKQVCEEATERFIATEHWDIALSLREIAHKLEHDPQDPLLRGLRERHIAQGEREEQIRALRVDHAQQTQQRQERYATQIRKMVTTQRSAEMEAARLRVAQEGGVTGVAAVSPDEARKTLRDLDGHVFVSKANRRTVREAYQRQQADSLDVLNTRIDALRAEQRQLQQEIVEQSRQWFAHDKAQACQWLGMAL